MAEPTVHENGHIKELSGKEGQELFNRAAVYHLGITGADFLRGLEAGKYEDSEDDPDVSEVLALVPFARL